MLLFAALHRLSWLAFLGLFLWAGRRRPTQAWSADPELPPLVRRWGTGSCVASWASHTPVAAPQWCSPHRKRWSFAGSFSKKSPPTTRPRRIVLRRPPHL